MGMTVGYLVVLVFCIPVDDSRCQMKVAVDTDIEATLGITINGQPVISFRGNCNRLIAQHASRWMLGRSGWVLKRAHCRKLPWITYHT